MTTMTEFETILATVNWARMAEPQDDGYDTDITLQLAQTGVTPLRPLPYGRRPVDGQATFCQGKVAVRPAPDHGRMSDALLPATVTHPNIAAAAGLLARWPKVSEQFTRLIDTVYLYTDPEQARYGDQALGSSSHSYEKDFGSIHATVDNALGFAQALVHEMAHQKLRALGVSIESAQRLTTNSPSEQFESPIRKDRRRPMSAVLHAQYSFIHVTALDLEMLAKANGERERQHILMLLARNVPRMKSGFEVLAQNVKTDDVGRLFIDAFMKWSCAVLQKGQAELNAAGYGD